MAVTKYKPIASRNFSAAVAKPKPVNPPLPPPKYSAGMKYPTLPTIKPRNPVTGTAVAGTNLNGAIDPTHPPPGIWGPTDGPFPDPNPPADTGAGGGGSGGGSPYYGWDFSYLDAQRNEALGAANIGTGSRIKQALIDLGLAKDDTRYAGLSDTIRGYIDDPTLEAAKNNKYSVFAQVARQEQKQTAQARADLARRGMLSSGALANATQDILDTAEAGRYTGVRQFTGTANDAISAYQQAVRDWAQKIGDARFQAAQLGYGGVGGDGSVGGGGGGGGQANYNTAGQTTYGVGAAPTIAGHSPTEPSYANAQGAVYAPRYAKQSDWRPQGNNYVDSEGNVFNGTGRLIKAAH